ncbi:hypothetical protein F4778DRAFT_779927 [Xylariomycetidae sp. FL2044]|nr:hypothetical protein F4778DRAFT_779927 [Xylariomycetidae sp. FL2044]
MSLIHPTESPSPTTTKIDMSLAEDQQRSKGILPESRQTELPGTYPDALLNSSRNSYGSQDTYDDESPDIFYDMDEQYHIEEATVMDAKEMKTKEVTIEPPALPQRNSLRTSKLLDRLKLNSIETATQSLTTAHELYLSSEEDASSSADDFSDYDSESNSDMSEKSPVRRESREVTARAVSVIYVGKPCVVDLASGRRSVSPVRSPQSSCSERSSTPSSASSATSYSPSLDQDSPSEMPRHPPRMSSLPAALSIDIPKQRPAFLQQDPFASSSYKLDSASKGISSPTSGPWTPKTPKAFHRLQKSISLARKRSRPNLKDAARNSIALPPTTAPDTNLTLDTAVSEEAPSRPEPRSATTAPDSPVTYNEILRAARKSSVPQLSTSALPSPQSQTMSPMSPLAAKKGLLSGLNMNNRRMSARIKSRP